MKSATILFIGYGIDPERKEAVSINIQKLMSAVEKNGAKTHLINIGYQNRDIDFTTGSSMLNAVVNRKNILKKIKDYIVKHNITHIHDTFVLYASSYLFTLPLKKAFPYLKVIKEIHNDFGFSKKIHVESGIRFFLNNKFFFSQVTKSFNLLFTRNPYLAQKYHYLYLPISVDIFPKTKRTTNNKLSCCYLGHPLRKKGIYEFFNLFSIMPDELKNKIEFNFALSDIGPREKVKHSLLTLAKSHRIHIHLHDIVEPHKFLGKNDIFILPIHDKFGATSTPNTILEAMEAGSLVITTDIESVKGILDNKVNSLLLKQPEAHEILNHIQFLLHNRKKLRQMTITARSYIIEHHSSKNINVILNQIYG